jgi:dienelactone hydrolase
MAVERVLYHADDKRFIGTLVYDERITTRRPPLLMAANRLGTSEEAINRPQMMASSHLIGLVADMYGDGRASVGPPEAAQLADASRGDPNERRQRIVAVLTAFLKESGKSGTGDLSRKAAVGFCFGGGNALELARACADVCCSW